MKIRTTRRVAVLVALAQVHLQELKKQLRASTFKIQVSLTHQAKSSMKESYLSKARKQTCGSRDGSYSKIIHSFNTLILLAKLLSVSLKSSYQSLFIDAIYLHGLYVGTFFHKGIHGFKVYHDSEYFKEKAFFHRDEKEAKKWT